MNAVNLSTGTSIASTERLRSIPFGHVLYSSNAFDVPLECCPVEAVRLIKEYINTLEAAHGWEPNYELCIMGPLTVQQLHEENLSGSDLYQVAAYTKENS